MIIYETCATLAPAAAALDDIHALLDRFQDVCRQRLAQPPDSDHETLFRLALSEIGTNILRHARPPEPFSLRLRAYPDRFVARYTDRGIACNEPLPIMSTDDDVLTLPVDGMGLLVAHQALDSLHYRRTSGGVNVWRLVKGFAAPAAS
jgi:anti-sigma regulatory factor (Ser/Thr protein kinase)